MVGSVLRTTVTKFFDWGLTHLLDMVDQARAVVSPAILPQIEKVGTSALVEWLSLRPAAAQIARLLIFDFPRGGSRGIQGNFKNPSELF
jgi:hypothetical protein